MIVQLFLDWLEKSHFSVQSLSRADLVRLRMAFEAGFEAARTRQGEASRH